MQYFIVPYLAANLTLIMLQLDLYCLKILFEYIYMLKKTFRVKIAALVFSISPL